MRRQRHEDPDGIYGKGGDPFLRPQKTPQDEGVEPAHRHQENDGAARRVDEDPGDSGREEPDDDDEPDDAKGVRTAARYSDGFGEDKAV